MEETKKVPEFLIEYLKKQYDENTVQDIINGYNCKRKVTCRVNTIKTNFEEIQKILEQENIEFVRDELFSDAIIFENVQEADLKKLPIYEEGKIYLQSLSSMLPPIILEPNPNENILDMCAAPGGKTSQMSAISCNKAMITACEKNKIRAERLKYNLNKLGASRVNVMVTDSRNLSDYFSFDKILLDAPCSGSGTEGIFGKDFSEELIKRSAKFQEELLRKALKLVKKGNEIVYSTCSILNLENENILNKFSNQIELVPIKIDESSKIKMLPVKLKGTVCIAPTELYEGFFVAKIRKK
jgi:NOL1/NOP2/sun family putative RNA methylase